MYIFPVNYVTLLSTDSRDLPHPVEVKWDRVIPALSGAPLGNLKNPMDVRVLLSVSVTTITTGIL